MTWIPHSRRRRNALAITTLLVLPPLLGVGCAHEDRAEPGRVARVWSPRDPSAEPPPSPEAVSTQHVRRAGEAIATVNGHVIERGRMVDLLLASHGPGLLDQLIGLDECRRLAVTKGLSITPADVERERRQALRRLVDPLSELTPEKIDLTAAQRVLDAVLAERNISRDEFELVIQRNAVLRRIIESELRFSDQQVRAEFDRQYGSRVQVRHIQVATTAEVDRITDRLNAGEAFVDLARTYSANQASAADGGLLTPFSETDERVPEPLRAAAFRLVPGEVSPPIRTGQWLHLVTLERRLPAGSVTLDEVRDELMARLRARATEPAMRQLFDRLLREAKIDIHDPVLRRAHEDRMGRRAQ